MITREQIEEADFLCGQARESVAIAHNCWVNLTASYNSLVRSYKATGLPHDAAVSAFETSMESQRASFVAALEHLERTNAFYNQLRFQFDRAGT
jgi:hypothetical protein